MHGGRSRLLLLANDLSERTMRNIQAVSDETGTKTIVLDISMEILGHSVGKKSGILSVNDDGFANKLITLCTE